MKLLLSPGTPETLESNPPKSDVSQSPQAWVPVPYTNTEHMHGKASRECRQPQARQSGTLQCGLMPTELVESSPACSAAHLQASKPCLLSECLLQQQMILVTRLRVATVLSRRQWLAAQMEKSPENHSQTQDSGFARTLLPHCSRCGFLVVSLRPFPPDKGTCPRSTSAAAAVLGCRSPSVSTHKSTAEGRVNLSPVKLLLPCF